MFSVIIKIEMKTMKYITRHLQSNQVLTSDLSVFVTSQAMTQFVKTLVTRRSKEGSNVLSGLGRKLYLLTL